MAILQARKIFEQAGALVVQFNKTIADANESQEKGIDRMLGRAGFRRSGDHYTRRTLVDSTAFDDIYETHSELC